MGVVFSVHSGWSGVCDDLCWSGLISVISLGRSILVLALVEAWIGDGISSNWSVLDNHWLRNNSLSNWLGCHGSLDWSGLNGNLGVSILCSNREIWSDLILLNNIVWLVGDSVDLIKGGS